MNIVPADPAREMLADTITFVRPRLERVRSVGDRLRTFWAGVNAARDLAVADVIEDAFLLLARESGLAAELGHRADDDLRHVIRWAMLGTNPFQ